MSSPAISVVMPSYNRESTIRAAAESVLRQTWQDFELIVVDDGSSDATVAALRAIDDPRLRILPQEVNRGVSAARNVGIDAARAPWVAFQDSDDEWLPEKLALQMARIEAMGDGLHRRLLRHGRDPHARRRHGPRRPHPCALPARRVRDRAGGRPAPAAGACEPDLHPDADRGAARICRPWAASTRS